MGRFVAIGGGTFEETDPLQEKIVRLSGNPVPNVLFIGTAAADSTNPLTSCKKSFKRVARGSIVKKLSLIRNTYSEDEIDALFDWADVVYVGGGNTEFMLKTWRDFGLIPRLQKVFQEDSAVLSGMSAGAICWFTDGYTDSDSYAGNEHWSCRLIKPGIDLCDAVFCPHYQDWSRHGFDEAVKDLQKPGIALSDNTAFVYNNGSVRYLSGDGKAAAYEISYDGVVMTKTKMCGT